MSEKVLDEENWKLEAQAVINDIKLHVKQVNLSEILPSTNQLIYFNVTTLENKNYCIELSSVGFRIVGSDYDLVDCKSNSKYYETPYSLLNEISEMYQTSFGNALLEKLKNIQQ